jgi:hypothetical protein
VFSRALAAELYKGSRRGPLLFWGFLFVPIFSFAADLLWLSRPIRVPNITPHIDLLFLLSHALQISSSPLAQIFFIAAAAVIFGGEYDSETWRLIAPRAPRTDWILAKLLLYAAGLFCSLALVALGTTLCAILEAASQLIPLASEARAGSPIVAFVAVFGISWLELLLLGLLTGLLAVTSRSVLIPAIAMILLTFCQSTLVSLIRVASVAGGDGTSAALLVLLPGLAADLARFFATHAEVSPGLYVTPRMAGIGLMSLLAWATLTLLLTLAWFRRQELSRE